MCLKKDKNLDTNRLKFAIKKKGKSKEDVLSKIPKKLWTILLLDTLLLIVIILAVFFWQIDKAQRRQKSERAKQKFDEEMLNNLKDGDVVLRQGNTFASKLIAKAFEGAEGNSHIAYLIKQNGKWQAIHSISSAISEKDGVRMEPLRDFVQDAKGGRVIIKRAKFYFDEVKANQAALDFLQKEAPFDYLYDLKDSSKLYCTELIRAVYLKGGAKDVFSLKEVGGIMMIDLAAFFGEDYWETVWP